ncbi:MAG: hypothetical protein M3Y81_23815 [Chloroflexota bacterium]|nr:hypothetical protein [Chloroflexota bacterium]
MTEKPFDWLIVLMCPVFGVIMVIAGFAMGQPTRIVMGVLFVVAGPLAFVALANARKRLRR